MILLVHPINFCDFSLISNVFVNIHEYAIDHMKILSFKFRNFKDNLYAYPEYARKSSRSDAS